MKNEEFTEYKKERRPYGDGDKRKEHSHRRGAKTFRRGRAIAFLELMKLKRSTIKQQLDEPELFLHNKIIKALRRIITSESLFLVIELVYSFLVELFYPVIHVILPSQSGQSVQ